MNQEYTDYKIRELERKLAELQERYAELEAKLRLEREGHNKTFMRLVNLRLDFQENIAMMKKSLDRFPSYSR